MSLFAELRRRKVFRVAIAYFAGSWLLIQVAETLLPVYGYGDAAIRAVVAVLAICAIPVMVISWLYQFTPGGLKKQYDIDRGNSPSSENNSSSTDVFLAVLPFDNLSTDPETQFFSDGVSEEIGVAEYWDRPAIADAGMAIPASSRREIRHWLSMGLTGNHKSA